MYNAGRDPKAMMPCLDDDLGHSDVVPWPWVGGAILALA